MLGQKGYSGEVDDIWVKDKEDLAGHKNDKPRSRCRLGKAGSVNETGQRAAGRKEGRRLYEYGPCEAQNK